MGQPEYYLTSNAADKDGGGMNSQPGDLHNLEQQPILHFLDALASLDFKLSLSELVSH